MTASASPVNWLGRSTPETPGHCCPAHQNPAATCTAGSAAQMDSTTRPMWPLHPEMIIFSMTGYLPLQQSLCLHSGAQTGLVLLLHLAQETYGPNSMPRRFSASFTGMGLTSQNRASIRSMYSIWSLRRRRSRCPDTGGSSSP